ncbi:hypothetical protein [Rickettsiella grylli]|nr:hypothetical protein [Rickettsiella grylli]
MMQKIIKWLLSGMFILNLAACASYHIKTTHYPSQETRLENEGRVIDDSLAQVMGNTDQYKLKNLIATAKPTQMTGWQSESTNVRFVFVSKKIFVNPEGQGCRDYQIKLIRGLFRQTSSFNYTACRNSEGKWHVFRH